MIDVILPVLNEQQALPWVLERMPIGYRPIVVDNGSTDASASIAAGLGATVVSQPLRGFGAACHSGLLAATSEVVCFMDCDASMDPGALSSVSQPVSDADVHLMLGARRPLAGAWPVHARLANRFLALELRRRTGVRLTDIGPMRAARRQELIDLQIQDRRFGWPLEMVLKAARKGWSIGEVPIEYRPRTGRSKVTGTVAGTIRAVRDMAGVLR